MFLNIPEKICLLIDASHELLEVRHIVGGPIAHLLSNNVTAITYRIQQERKLSSK